MTTRFHKLQIADEIELKGPLGSFTYQGHGSVLWKGATRTVREFGLVCGGSGITPILQVVRSVLDDPSDQTRLWLLYANKTELDILCREELDEMLALHGHDRLHIHYTLSSTPDQWVYGSGRITDKMIATHLPQPSPDGMILACGPNAMIEETLKPGLERCGWDVGRSLVVF